MTSISASSSSDSSVTAFEWLAEPPIWIGDGNLLDVRGYFWGAAALELGAAPRRDSSLREAEAAVQYRQLAGRITRSLRSWENQGSLELRYVWTGDNQLRVLLIARALGASLETARAWAGGMLKNVVSLYPAGYQFSPLHAPLRTDIDGWAEIERAEEVRSPAAFVPAEIASYYYLTHPLGGSGRAWPALAKALTELDDAGFISVALMPTRMTDLEREAVDHICTVARHFAEPRQEHDFFGNPMMQPADAAASDVLRSWQAFTGSGLLARVGIASSQRELRQVTSLVGAILTEGSDQSANESPNQFKIVTGLSEFDAFQTSSLGVVFPRAQHPVWSLPDDQAPISVERLPYFFSEEEAGGLLLMPVPDEQGIPGLATGRRVNERRSTIPTQAAEPGVRLGGALHRGIVSNPIYLPLAAINRHTLIVGASGSGKTTTVMSLITQLWRDYQIPFLVIESTKTEYRSLLGVPGLEDLKVITLANETIAPLRLNPLDPPLGVRCEVFKGAVLAALKLAMPLFPPQPQILATAIARVYRRAGWEDETTTADGLAPPTLRDLRSAFMAEAQRIGYQGEARNIERGLDARVESLLTGSLGKLLDTVTSSNFDDLLSVPVVIEMNDLYDADNQAVLAAFVLERVRFGAKRRGGSAGRLRHVTVVEEAHRLLAKANSGTADVDSGNQARADSVRMFCEAIAELRSLGEGFVLSTQSPSALADAAVANAGTRIAHRMESSSDRQVMLDDFGADEQIRDLAARLRQGEAIVRWSERDEVEVIRVEAPAGVDSSRKVSDDVVAEHMQAHRADVQRLLPYRLCSTDICPGGCKPAVRAAGNRVAEEVEDAASELWQEARSSGSGAAPAILRLVTNCVGGDLQRTYCGAAHLGARNIAFASPDGSDMRPGLIRAVREVVDHGAQ
jgi:hypothetical protein